MQTHIHLQTPQHWEEYELIDSGAFEKLERFGAYIVARPEPQAAWDKSLSDKEWQQQAHAIFRKEKGSTEKGRWELNRPQTPERWWMSYRYQQMHLQFKIALSSFKHVGIFPEQAANWDYLYTQLRQMPVEQPRVLNLFAYTGGASLAAAAAGAQVVHVDSVKPVLSWARENMERSQLQDIRWMPEDAFKFVQREVKRGNRYHAVLLDPPAYGRGANGEKWVLEEQINEMLKACAALLDPDHHLLLINLYSLGFSTLILENLLRSAFPKQAEPLDIGELYLADSFGKRLPLGIYGRLQQGF
ncbi:class I SAM-dependent methyltransferase [Eisenibacter elegans]|uniref:class I SAM-dependent methyltransferase n=1 Tax=Eisenibacter elegans TaxID=997 RepID=UPI00040646D9|nr:class I SAM-dependent methyltransferase [Eisenibacter elegans]